MKLIYPNHMYPGQIQILLLLGNKIKHRESYLHSCLQKHECFQPCPLTILVHPRKLHMTLGMKNRYANYKEIHLKIILGIVLVGLQLL